MTAPFNHYTAMSKIASEAGGPPPFIALCVGDGMSIGALTMYGIPKMKDAFTAFVRKNVGTRITSSIPIVELGRRQAGK